MLLKELLAVSTVLFSLSAHADAPSGPAYYITAGSRQDCTLIHNYLSVARQSPVTSECASLDAPAEEVDAARTSGKYPYHYDYRHRDDGSIQLSVENWNRLDDTDFQKNVWTIGKASDDTQKVDAQKLINRAVETDRTRRTLRELLLTKGLVTSKRLELDANGEYYDKNKQSEVPFDEAYQTYLNEAPKHKHFLRAAIEIVSFLGLGCASYWITAGANSVDWDYNWSAETFRKKLITGEGFRFDDNPMYLNTPGHPMAGALYYLVARTNNMTALESFLFAFAASALWENFVEFHEVFSMNDQTFTPVGGFAIGEAMFQLNRFFMRGSNNIVNHTLAAVFAGPADLLTWINKNKPPRAENLDRFGFPTDVWHQFDLSAGAGAEHLAGGGTQFRSDVGIDTQIINIGEYGRAGVVNRFISDTVFTQLTLKGSFGQQGLLDFLFFTKVAFMGYYKQSVERGVTGDLKGYSFFIGPATAYQHMVHRDGNFLDQMGIVNVLGPTVDLAYYYKGFKIRATFDVYGDFAAVRSYAVDKYEAEGGSLAGTKSVLANQRYYFALGVTTSGRIVANYGNFELGAEVRYDYFDSIEGHDRRQERITNDFSLTDHRFSYKLWAAYTLPVDYIKLALSFEQVSRGGEIGDVVAGDTDFTVLGNVIFTF